MQNERYVAPLSHDEAAAHLPPKIDACAFLAPVLFTSQVNHLHAFIGACMHTGPDRLLRTMQYQYDPYKTPYNPYITLS